MVPRFSRRTFLTASAGLGLAAACGSGKGKVIDATNTTTAAAPLNLIFASFDPLSGVDQRMTFAVLKDQTPLPKEVPEVTLEFGFQGKVYGARVPAARHDDGIENRPFYEVTTKFDRAGVWMARVHHGDLSATAAFDVGDAASSALPAPGRPLISTKTPTMADGQGVNPICTRQPACPWHDVSLDQALLHPQPIVLLFATPALCQSATCGPVLDILLSQKDIYEAKGVRFIHCEIYTDLTGKAQVPAVDAFHLTNDPCLFTAGRDGIIKQRIAGPFDRADAKLLLDELVA